MALITARGRADGPAFAEALVPAGVGWRRGLDVPVLDPRGARVVVAAELDGSGFSSGPARACPQATCAPWGFKSTSRGADGG